MLVVKYKQKNGFCIFFFKTETKVILQSVELGGTGHWKSFKSAKIGKTIFKSAAWLSL